MPTNKNSYDCYCGTIFTAKKDLRAHIKTECPVVAALPKAIRKTITLKHVLLYNAAGCERATLTDRWRRENDVTLTFS